MKQFQILTNQSLENSSRGQGVSQLSTSLNRYSIKLLFIIILMAFVLPINAQIKVYGANGKESFSEETIILKLIPKSDNNKLDENKVFAPGVLATVVPVVAKTGLSITKSILKNRQEKFVSEYSAHLSGSGFFKQNRELSLYGLELLRVYPSEKEGEPDKIGLKANFSVEIDESGNAFRYRLSGIEVMHSKALANKTDAINLQFEIQFNALIIDEGKSEFSEIAKRKITVNGVKLGKTYGQLTDYNSDWFPIPELLLNVAVSPSNSRDITKDEAITEAALHYGLTLEEALEKKWLMSNTNAIRYIKVNDNKYKKITGYFKAGGAYSIMINVKEANPRQLTSKALNSFLDDSGDDISAVIGATIDAFSKVDNKDN